MRWARISLCALGAGVMLLVGAGPGSGATHRTAATVGTFAAGTTLTLASQTPWVSPAAPWFSLSLGVGEGTGSIGDLHAELIFYNKINDATEMTQATNAMPDKGVLTHVSAPVTATASGRVAATCVTVLSQDSATAPTVAPANTVACPPGASTVDLNCTPGDGTCGGVYPVSVALYRQGSDSALARFTTFLTYQEPGLSSSDGAGGPLRVSLVMPVAGTVSPTSPTPTRVELEPVESLVDVMAAHRGVAVTLAASPVTVSSLTTVGGQKGRRAVRQLQALSTAPAGGDQLLTQSYVPIDVADLVGVGLNGEIGAQLARGTALLRAAGLRPSSGTWVDTASAFSSGEASDLGTGLRATGSTHLVLDDTNLAPGGSDKLTFAQPFSLSVGDSHVTAAGTDSQLDSLFSDEPDDPVLAANQIVATLEFIHFENPFTLDHRGIVLEPPSSWQPSDTLLTTLLTEMAGNPVLSPVTLNQFFAEVQKGGNEEPSSRHLLAGTPSKADAIGSSSARHLAAARSHLVSLGGAVGEHPAVLTPLSDLLLAAENRQFDPEARAEALANFTQRFGAELNVVSLAPQGTITFTSRTAPIPISVLSSATFPVKVLLSLDSDKFTFPDGNSQKLDLDRPTTPVRIQARSITSGDRLPVGVTLTTPDGQLVIARAVLTVHSTSISLVGIALTVLAAMVLLFWWARTWRKARRRRPRVA